VKGREEAMSEIHLGINTCFAVKRWPEPEQWITLVKDELGLDCCQFSLDLIDPRIDQAAQAAYAEAVRTSAANHKLLIQSTFTGLAAYSWSQLLHPLEPLREAAMHWYEGAIDLTAQMGAWGTGGHIGAVSVRDAADPTRRQALLKEMTERLNTLTDYAAQKGLQFLLFENMAVTREYGHSIEEAQTLLNSVAGPGVPLILCLDVGHPCALHTGTSSDDYLAWLNYPWARPPVVHLQQTDRAADHHWPFTTFYNEMGIVQAEPVVHALRQWSENTDIYVFLEPIHPFEADDTVVISELKESVNYWKTALQS
jgi:sugar phosphate isomerase/epimerase